MAVIPCSNSWHDRRTPRASALLTLCAALSACGSESKAPAVAAAAAAAVVRDTAFLAQEALAVSGVTVAPAARIAWRDAWQLPARLVLDPTTTQPLGSIVEGRVVKVFVQPGDRVRGGQVLVTIHSHELTSAHNELAQAAAGRMEANSTAQVAAAAAARSERLYAAQAGSLADVERARAANTAAQAGQRRAEAEFARASEIVDHLRPSGPISRGTDPEDVIIRAPFDGVVVARHAEPGSVVLPGAPLMTISRSGSVLLELRVPEAALSAATPGAEVRFSVPAYPGRAFTARVLRISPALDSITRTAEVHASVPNRDGALRAEMTASAELFGVSQDSVMAVPIGAIQDFEGDTVIVTGVKRGSGLLLEAVRVRVGRRSGGLAELLSGVAPGTPVVGAGAAIARAEVLRQRDARTGEPDEQQ
jgi:membrane fusion protein, heavy metal efflux system